MNLFIRILFTITLSFVISNFISTSLKADDEKIPSSDKFIAVEVMPVMTEEITPVYPDHLRDTKATVYVKAFVDPEGIVKQTEVAKSSGINAFDESALHAALKCKYKPAMTNGKPIGVWVTYKVEFVPSKDSPEEKLEEVVPEMQDVDLMPEMIYEKQPVYPEEVKKEKIEGTVWVKALIGEDGLVIKSEISKSSGNDILDKSALDAALENKYKPAIKDGKPISTWVTYKVDFCLTEDDNKKETE